MFLANVSWLPYWAEQKDIFIFTKGPLDNTCIYPDQPGPPWPTRHHSCYLTSHTLFLQIVLFFNNLSHLRISLFQDEKKYSPARYQHVIRAFLLSEQGRTSRLVATPEGPDSPHQSFFPLRLLVCYWFSDLQVFQPACLVAFYRYYFLKA